MPSSTARSLLLILLFGGLSFFTRLGGPQLWDRDEPRNARCAWEMSERQDWVVPTFNGELRTHKPILLYWLTMTSYAIFGVNEFAARLGSAILALGTLLLTYRIGCRLFGDPAARWAAVILSTTLMFNVAAHAATPDSALIFCSTLAMTLFVEAVPASLTRETASASQPCSRVPADPRWLAGAGLAMGLAVLAKGPVGFVLPTAVWSVFLWLSPPISYRGQPQPVLSTGPGGAGRWRAELLSRLRLGHVIHSLRAWHPLLVTALMLLVAAPWYVLVGYRTEGVWLREFFLEHHVSRALEPMEGHRGNPLLFYPVTILVGFFPWSALTIPAGIWIARRRQGAGYDRRFAFLLAWVGVYVAAFSLAGTKLPSYVTPTYPALALMVGHFVARWPRSSASPARWWPRWSAATLIIVGLLLTVAIPWAARVYLPREEGLAAVGLILLFGGLACLMSFRGERLTEGMGRLAITALAFIVALFGWVAPRVSEHQQIQTLLAAAGPANGGSPVASWGVHEPSWVYYAGHSIPLLPADNPGPAAVHVARHQGLLITTRSRYERLRAQLPAELTVWAEIPYFLKRDQLVLLGPQRPLMVQKTGPPRR